MYSYHVQYNDIKYGGVSATYDRFDLAHEAYCGMRDKLLATMKAKRWIFDSGTISLFRATPEELKTIQEGYYNGKTKEWREMPC